MPRKSKAAADAPATQTPRKQGTNDTPKSSKRKRVDWATIDEKGKFKGFELIPSKAGKKRKTETAKDTKGAKDVSMDADIHQVNPFNGGELSDTYLSVSPDLEWESTGRYKKFTIDSAEFEVEDIVYIKADDSQVGDKNAPVQGWVAKVLEVRAGDSSHVYLRVYWMYRPEDLPGGRKPHHGRNELIASNDMAIIDAMTVESGADVKHYQEQKDQAEVLDPDQLFWRQTYDVTKKPSALSQLPLHCVDKKPHNPDDLLVQCDVCENWLHGPCLEKAALREAYKMHDLTYTEKTPKAKGRKKKSSGPAAFAAQLSTAETGKTHLTITDQRPEPKHPQSWDVSIKCLLCGAIIDNADSKPIQNGAVPTALETTSSGLLVPIIKNEPHTPTNNPESSSASTPIIPTDISSPIKAADPPAAALAPPTNDDVVAPEAKVNGARTSLAKLRPGTSVGSTASKKRKRKSSGDSPNPTSKGTKRRAMGDASKLGTKLQQVKTMSGTPPPKPDHPNVLQSSVKSITELFWKAN